MKFKRYKDARNWVIQKLLDAGYFATQFNIEQMVAHLFTSRGIGEDFELYLDADADFRLEAINAIKVPRRDEMSDGVWVARMRRVAAMLGVDFGDCTADEMESLIWENALIAKVLSRSVK